jgi:hypothetical protein
MRAKSFRKKVSSATVTPSYPRKGRQRGTSTDSRRRPTPSAILWDEPTFAQPPDKAQLRRQRLLVAVPTENRSYR